MKYPAADWEHTMTGELGERVTIAAYGPREDFGGSVTIAITWNGRSVDALLFTAGQREELARAWMEANRIADGEPPALTVAAVDPARMEALGELADAAQEAGGDE